MNITEIYLQELFGMGLPEASIIDKQILIFLVQEYRQMPTLDEIIDFEIIFVFPAQLKKRKIWLMLKVNSKSGTTMIPEEIAYMGGTKYLDQSSTSVKDLVEYFDDDEDEWNGYVTHYKEIIPAKCEMTFTKNKDKRILKETYIPIEININLKRNSKIINNLKFKLGNKYNQFDYDNRLIKNPTRLVNKKKIRTDEDGWNKM